MILTPFSDKIRLVVTGIFHTCKKNIHEAPHPLPNNTFALIHIGWGFLDEVNLFVCVCVLSAVLGEGPIQPAVLLQVHL